MVPLLLGAAISAGVPFVRYQATWAYQFSGKKSGRRWTFAHQALAVSAVAVFLIGVVIVVTGVFLNLPRDTLRAESAEQALIEP